MDTGKGSVFILKDFWCKVLERTRLFLFFFNDQDCMILLEYFTWTTPPSLPHSLTLDSPLRLHLVMYQLDMCI
jgi:hypothetical protein